MISPLLWSIVVDELLCLLGENGFDVQGYADDIVILIRGRFEDTISNLLQNALNIVAKWCSKNGLNVNPKKTSIVIFSRKRKRDQLVEPFLQGEKIHFSKEVKYLGVILDDKLSWNPHLDKTIQKARASIWTCRKLMGRNWGIRPKLARWMYDAISKPILTYAAPVWWKKAEVKSTQAKLSKLQRLACVGITGAMRTAPTAALEVLLDLPPLHIVIKKEALLFTARLISGDSVEDKKHVHPSTLRVIEQEDGLRISLVDLCLPRFNFIHNFKVFFPTGITGKTNDLNPGRTATSGIPMAQRLTMASELGSTAYNPDCSFSPAWGKETLSFRPRFTPLNSV